MEKEINKAIGEASGNLNIEGLNASDKECKSIAKIISKYKETLGPEAIDSLLYAIAMGDKIMEEESKNDRTK